MMKNKSICLLLLLVLLVFSFVSCFSPNPDESDNKQVTTGTEKIINVYLIAGQSNAVGVGHVKCLHRSFSEDKINEYLSNK